jgi:hypothetical protein
MGLRPDYGSVFLPLEFSNSVRVISGSTAAGGAGAASSQIKMDAGQARFFLGSIKATAASQRRQFASCLIVVLLALFVMALFLLFQVLFAVGDLYPNPAAVHAAVVNFAKVSSFSCLSGTSTRPRFCFPSPLPSVPRCRCCSHFGL